MIQREWQRIDPKYLDDDEQRFWATIAGRQMRFDERQAFVQKFTERGASKGALETFLSTCAAQNPNRRLRLIALADRVSMRVDRADFDDLVTLVTQAPPWEKDRAAGVRILLRAIAEGKPDAPEQILARWTWRLARAVRKTLDRKASQEYPDAKRLLGALANSRGNRHEENAARLVKAALEMPRDVGAALLATAEGYTPRATKLLDDAREQLGSIEEIAAALADDLPAPKTGPSRSGAAAGAARRTAASRRPRRRPRQTALAAVPRRPRRTADGPAAEPRRRRRRRKPLAADGATARLQPAAIRAARQQPGLGARSDHRAFRVAPTSGRVGRRRRDATLEHARPARHRVPGRARHRDLAVRPAGAADPARRRGLGPQAAPDHRRARRRASSSSRSSRPGSSTSSASRTTCCATSRSRCSSSSPRRCSSRGSALLLEKPFARLTRFRAGGGGFLLGASLGLVFVPCAGPVLATISVVAATNHVGLRAILLTVAYALGAAVPMLLIALGGQRASQAPARRRRRALRIASGVVIGLVALGIAFNLDTRFQTALPGYTQALQKHIEDTARGRDAQLAKITRREATRDGRRRRTSPASPRPGASTARLRPAPPIIAGRRLVQLEAAHARGAPRQGRAARLLDVLVHQLPAHAAAPRSRGTRPTTATGS